MHHDQEKTENTMFVEERNLASQRNRVSISIWGILDELVERQKTNRKALTDRHLKVCELEASLVHGRPDEIDDPYSSYGSLKGNPLYRKIAFSRGNEQYHFSEHAFKQLAKVIVAPMSFLEKMKKNREDELIVAAINACLRSSKTQNGLLRLVKNNPEADSFDVRALLPINYNRLDNLYVTLAIIWFLETNKDMNFNLAKIVWEPDFLQVEVVLNDTVTQLTRVGDEVLVGVVIRNSEIDNSAVEIEVLIKRLVCLNGMTAVDKHKLRIPANFLGHETTKYVDCLPPDNLPVQSQINRAIADGIRSSLSNADKTLEKLKQRAAEMAAIPIRLETNQDIRIALNSMFDEMGRGVLLGINIDEIIEAYWEEIRDFPESEGTAWALINAMTRYSSRTLGGRRSKKWNGRLEQRISREAYDFSSKTKFWNRLRNKSKHADARVINPPVI